MVIDLNPETLLKVFIELENEFGQTLDIKDIIKKTGLNRKELLTLLNELKNQKVIDERMPNYFERIGEVSPEIHEEMKKIVMDKCEMCNESENASTEWQVESSADVIIYYRCKNCGYMWDKENMKNSTKLTSYISNLHRS